MTATSALSYAPSNALRFWSSGRDIFVQIPSLDPNQPATVLRFPYGPSGLAKALSLLSLQPYDFAGIPLTPGTKWTNPCPKDPILDTILRRRGMLP